MNCFQSTTVQIVFTVVVLGAITVFIVWAMRSRRKETDRSLIRRFSGHKDVMTSIRFSPDGIHLASGNSDRSVRLWHVATGAPVWANVDAAKGVTAVRFSPDGARVAAASEDGHVRLVGAKDGRTLAVLAGSGAPVTSVAFSPAGRTVAGGCEDGAVILWDVASSAAPRRLAGHEHAVRRVAFTIDGRGLVSAGDDGKVILWDVEAGRAGLAFPELPTPVDDLAVSPDGHLAVVAHRQHLSVLDLGGGSILWTKMPAGVQQNVGAVDFHPQGSLIASGDTRGAILLLDPMTGEMRGDVKFPSSVGVTCVCFSPDGGSIAGGSYQDRDVFHWRAVWRVDGQA